MEEHICDCYYQKELDPDCSHPTRQRDAHLGELTDAQLAFIFTAEQERERMKNENMESSQNQQQMKQNL